MAPIQSVSHGKRHENSCADKNLIEPAIACFILYSCVSRSRNENCRFAGGTLLALSPETSVLEHYRPGPQQGMTAIAGIAPFACTQRTRNALREASMRLLGAGRIGRHCKVSCVLLVQVKQGARDHSTSGATILLRLLKRWAHASLRSAQKFLCDRAWLHGTAVSAAVARC